MRNMQHAEIDHTPQVEFTKPMEYINIRTRKHCALSFSVTLDGQYIGTMHGSKFRNKDETYEWNCDIECSGRGVYLLVYLRKNTDLDWGYFRATTADAKTEMVKQVHNWLDT